MELPVELRLRLNEGSSMSEELLETTDGGFPFSVVPLNALMTGKPMVK